MTRFFTTGIVDAGRGILLISLLLVLLCAQPQQPGASGTRPLSLSIDIGNIPERPIAPEFAFERFLQTRSLDQLQFAPDNRSIYFIRNDGEVDNIFAMDLTSRSLRQVTHLAEPVSGFGVDHQGRFLIIVHDVAGNENHDLYRFDLVSGDLQRHLFAELGFDPRSDRARNRALSPLYHVDRIRDPLQIHQGANDNRVPRVQSDWLVQCMREMGSPVEYFVYPDEGHGFTRFENERKSCQRLVSFLRRQLTEDGGVR